MQSSPGKANDNSKGRSQWTLRKSQGRPFWISSFDPQSVSIFNYKRHQPFKGSLDVPSLRHGHACTNAPTSRACHTHTYLPVPLELLNCAGAQNEQYLQQIKKRGGQMNSPPCRLTWSHNKRVEKTVCFRQKCASGKGLRV